MFDIYTDVEIFVQYKTSNEGFNFIKKHLLLMKTGSRFLDSATYSAKGQLNSEWIFELIVSPKMPTKYYQDFCPGSL